MDAFLGFLNNPLFLTVGPIAWGLAVKHHPAWKNIPNGIIPYGTALLAFIVKVFAPAEAHAATLLLIPGLAPVAGVAGVALSAAWQSILNSLVYETFLRTPLKGILVKQ